ncbi:OmpL47-type beta-barrel domain-containing protein [Monashia sp. NPDC004114]
MARRLLAGASVAAVVAGGINLVPALASTVTSATFTGGGGTALVGGTLYARQGATLTLTVITSSDTKCVEVTGAASPPIQTSPSAQTSWTFTLTAPSGDGAQAVTVAASPDFNSQPKCTGMTRTGQALYVLDNTGPTVSAQLTPAPNAAGWNRSDVTVAWTATDAGSGVAAAQPFQTDLVTTNGDVTKTTPAQLDRVGNASAPGSVTVHLDKSAPTITATQTQNANGTTTVTFTCNDAGGSGVTSCLADGTSTSSKTVNPGVTVTGTATDAAGNTGTASSTAPAVDTTPPTLSGAPTTQPNAKGWYKGDVTVHWTAADPQSGIPDPPADTTITGSGEGLTSTVTVQNGAGLSTTASSSPPVKIDRTAPSTTIGGNSNQWVNGQVDLTLTPTDNLSQVASTSYSIDGGATQTGTAFSLTDEGDHSVTFFSTDNAGNVEAPTTVHVKIDKTAPTIGHTFDPSAYVDGKWTNEDVTVTFVCDDKGGSGIADCTAPVTKDADGQFIVPGNAADAAGNSASNSASIWIDKSPPTITANAVGDKNGAGWYKDDVTVTFTVGDALSGVVGAPANQVLGEGADQSASATVHDAAGNSASDSVKGINVDKTAPTLSASFPSGWQGDDVTVDWSCTDMLSKVATPPANDTVTGEGANLSSSASCTDVAGNKTTKTVDGIKIDRTTPTTTATIAGTDVNGWYGHAVSVTLTGHDNLSGIADTYYTVDGGPTQTYDAPFSVGGDGVHHIAYWSKDVAGNDESAGAPITVKIDTTAPVTKVINPISPVSGWFVVSGIPFAFDAHDGGSGVAATYYTIDGGNALTYGQPFSQDLSNGTHSVEVWSIDAAGNSEQKQTFTVNVDTIAPTITGAATPAANVFGWNNTDVDVKFTCTDGGSGVQTGVAGCAGDTTLQNEGADQSVHGDAVDVAGNHSGTDVTGINIDKTKPTLVGIPSDPNAAGWYKADVPVTWVGHDALSGIDPSSQPAPSSITGEGANLGAGPVTITDQAGNVSEPASVSGIKIDRTPPVITGAPKTTPNQAGWYSGEVTVDFLCTDNLSGVATCPTSRLLKGNGANQSVTSDAATDVAANSSVGKTVGGINIDGTAPTTSSNNTCTAVNGWCTGSTADVVLTATDQAGLSGVKEIHYKVDSGAEQVASGATSTVTVPLDGSGSATLTYWAVDNAGNAEAKNNVALEWDNIAPTVSHDLSPAPNADEWNKSDVTVTFSAKDDDKGSGVAKVSDPVTVSTETSGRTVIGTATDTAGNVGSDSVGVKLDKTAPTITGAITGGHLTASGWYDGPVTVTFTCNDTLSGVATCPAPVKLTANGTNEATGSVSDRAGNTASATVPGIKIDTENPTLLPGDVNVGGKTYTLGAVPAATCSATDSYSGIASCAVTVIGGKANGVGTFTYTATAIDRAGNTSTMTGTYRVIYRFDGFLQPINDTAHQVGTSTSIFKAGSTVPTKLQLKKADGTVVQSVEALGWLTPVKGSGTSAAVDESVYTPAADSGTDYKYDSTDKQYMYNWKTGSAGGFYWRIGVQLDDGQTYYVNIGLR